MLIVVRARRSRRRTRRSTVRLVGLALLAMLMGAGSWHHLAPNDGSPTQASPPASITAPPSITGPITITATGITAADLGQADPVDRWADDSQLIGVGVGSVAPPASPEVVPATAVAVRPDARRSAHGTRAPPSRTR